MHKAVKAFIRAARAGDVSVPRTLIIQGPAGTLKTQCVTGAVRWFRWMNRQPDVTDYVLAEMVRVNSQTQPRGSLAGLFTMSGSFTEAQEAGDAIREMLPPRALFIDDLGAEPAWCSPRTMASGLSDLLDARWVAGKFTCITTNLTGKEILAKYEARLHSRCVIGAQSVILGGHDRRAIK